MSARDTGYAGRSFMWFTSVAPDKFWDITSNYATTASFRIHSNSLFTDCPTIWHYVFWATNSVVKKTKLCVQNECPKYFQNSTLNISSLKLRQNFSFFLSLLFFFSLFATNVTDRLSISIRCAIGPKSQHVITILTRNLGFTTNPPLG
jgi:hypothetical protein